MAGKEKIKKGAKMKKLIKFIPVFYMATMITLSISIINYFMGNTDNILLFWGRAFMIGFPLALFYGSFIGRIMGFVSKKFGTESQIHNAR